MNIIEIKKFIDLKNNINCQNLETDTINLILNSFDFNDVKKQKNKKFSNQIQKSSKIKLVKDKNGNKINLILNKISENNIQNILIEFFTNIKINNIEDYNEFIKIIYIKMLMETTFLKIYFDFFKNIINTYNVMNKWVCSFFYDLVENKFKLDYYDDIVSCDWDFLKEYNSENYRINNLNIIREMIIQEFLNNNFECTINTEILTQIKYFSDIYYWFKDTTITDEQCIKITEITNNDIDVRDKILLQSLIDTPKTNKIIFKKKY